jgi:hypothetical protein
LGVSEFKEIVYELSEIIQLIDLPSLDDPCSLEEIQVVLEEMPFDHAPGPDGFNGAFFFLKNASPSSERMSSDYVGTLPLAT